MKTSINFFISFRPLVRPCGITRIPLDGI